MTTRHTKKARFASPRIEELETRLALSGLLDQAAPLRFLDGAASATVASASTAQYFHFDSSEASRLVARVSAASAATRLTLYGPDDRALLQSDGTRAGPGGLIDFHIGPTPSSYVLAVEPLGATTGFTLDVSLASATAPLQALPVGVAPYMGAYADLNADGHLDLVTANSFSHDLSVLLGRGDGTFAPERRYAAGLGVSAVTAADVDGDGKLDIVGANHDGASLSLLRGNGDGTFAPQSVIETGGVPSDVAALDANDDGRLDLLYTDFSLGRMVVLTQGASGEFLPTARYAVDGGPYHLALADLDADGLTDVAVGCYNSGEVRVLRGQADGTFADWAVLTAGPATNSVAVADLDADGRPDLVATNYEAGTVSVFYGRAGGFEQGATLQAERGVIAAAFGDFNQDGHLDFAVTNATESLVLFLGRGDRQFEIGQAPVAGDSPSFVLAGDYNQDGLADLAVARYISGAVAVLLGKGDGTFQGPEPGLTPAGTTGVAAADINGDGHMDLVTANYGVDDVAVLLGLGDGTFLLANRFASTSDTFAVATGDLNGDGRADLVLGNSDSGTISVSLANGPLSWAGPTVFAVGDMVRAVATGDFNGDGHHDVAAACQGSDQVVLLLGDGQGGLALADPIAVGAGPGALAVADFDGDGRDDLATADVRGGTVSVVFGAGAVQTLQAGVRPSALVALDFDGDGLADLAVLSAGSASVRVFLNSHTAPGQFTQGADFLVGPDSRGLAAGDFNHDGKADLAATSLEGNTVWALYGAGNGTFQAGATLGAGARPWAVAAADFDGDGHDDLAVGNYASGDVSAFLGRDDGFRGALTAPISNGPSDVAAADFDNNGLLDLVTVTPSRGTVSVRLSLVDPRFPTTFEVTVGGAVSAVTTGDFNRDGRQDIAVALACADSVIALLGRGDGTFTVGAPLAVGHTPLALIAADLNGDGLLDLATANALSGDVSVLLGKGDGAFRAARSAHAGAGVGKLAVADMDLDGKLDVVAGNLIKRNFVVLAGLGDGTFAAPAVTSFGFGLDDVLVADLDADGRPDVAVASRSDGAIHLFRGTATGPRWVASLSAPDAPAHLGAADINLDGRLDLVAAMSETGQAQAWLGQGGLAFSAGAVASVSPAPSGLLVADMSGDGLQDLVTVGAQDNVPVYRQGFGQGTFYNTGVIAYPVHADPLTADLNSDGVLDVAVITDGGKLLVRLGDPTSPDFFAAPIVVNPGPRQIVDAAAITVNGAQKLVVVDRGLGTVSLLSYVPALKGFTGQALASHYSALRAKAEDVNGDGRGDLIVTLDAGKAIVYLQTPAGEFAGPATVADVGVRGLGLTTVTLPGAGRPSLAVCDITGNVRVLSNEVAPLATQLRLRGGAGLLWDWVPGSDEYGLSGSIDLPLAAVSADFDGDGIMDLATVGFYSGRVDLLWGTATGGFLNPQRLPGLVAGEEPVGLVTADFNGDGYADLASFGRKSSELTVFLSDGSGGLTPVITPGAEEPGERFITGGLAAGLSVGDLNADGRPDLLVGCRDGSVLALYGNGDGTFAPYHRLDTHVALAADDLDGDGLNDFVFSNQAQDRLIVRYSASGRVLELGRASGVLDPGSVRIADLDHDGAKGLVVLNRGTNTVALYAGVPGGGFAAPVSFFTGRSPEGLTIADANGDGLDDLVIANAGSNDVSIFFSAGQGAQFCLTQGPRLVAGLGPVATAVSDVTGDGVADVLVLNRLSNCVYVLRGLGHGTFDDGTPLVLITGRAPVALAVGQFDARPGLDLVVANSGSGDLSFYSGLAAGLGSASPLLAERRIAAGGSNPYAMLAGDWSGDGRDDLVLLSREDRRVSLLLGGADGPAVAQTAVAGGAHPVDLAFAGLHAGRLDLYLALASSETLAPLSFDLGGDGAAPPAPPGPLPEAPSLPTAQDQQAAEVTQIVEAGSPLEAVGTAVVAPAVGRPQEDAHAPVEAATGAAAEEREEEEATAAGEAAPAPALGAFLLGVDELPFEGRFRPPDGPIEGPDLPGPPPARAEAQSDAPPAEQHGAVPPPVPVAGQEEGAPEVDEAAPAAETGWSFWWLAALAGPGLVHAGQLFGRRESEREGRS